MTKTPRRMDIWYADLPLKEKSSIQGGKRPVVILSNDKCNVFNPVITVVPMTRQMKKLALPTHVVIDAPDGGYSVVLAEQIMAIDKSLLDDCIGSVRNDEREAIELAVLGQLGLNRGEE